MARRDSRARSLLWPSLIAIPAIAVLLALGTWQVERLHWKEEAIADRAARRAAPPIDLGDAPATADMDFRRVSTRGYFRHDREMHLLNRVRDGRIGVHVITPLIRAGLPAVLVDRGWVPLDRADPSRRAPGQITGEVTVTGILRRDGRLGMFTPDNRPDADQWYYIDIAAMAAHAGIAPAFPVYVAAGPAANPGGLPRGVAVTGALRNDHLQYAITWYALAAALAVIYLISIRRAAGRAPSGSRDRQ